MLTSGTNIQIRADGTQIRVDDLAIADLIYDPFQDTYCEVIDILTRTTFIDDSVGGSTSQRLRPVVIHAGTIGDEIPRHDIAVSQAQYISKTINGTSECMPANFTAASTMVQSGNAELVKGKTKVTYFAIFTEQCATFVADGLPVLSTASSEMDWSPNPTALRVS